MTKSVKMSDLSTSEAAALAAAAGALNIPKEWLFGLIKTESGWNPTIHNPIGTANARGLIQWIDKTAQGMGYANSLDLVNKNPTREAQLLGPVVAYLKKWLPITSPEDLAAVNFYPANRGARIDVPLSATIQAQNPGVTTVRDYFNKYMAKNIPGTSAAVVALLAGVAAFF